MKIPRQRLSAAALRLQVICSKFIDSLFKHREGKVFLNKTTWGNRGGSALKGRALRVGESQEKKGYGKRMWVFQGEQTSLLQGPRRGKSKMRPGCHCFPNCKGAASKGRKLPLATSCETSPKARARAPLTRNSSDNGRNPLTALLSTDAARELF